MPPTKPKPTIIMPNELKQQDAPANQAETKEVVGTPEEVGKRCGNCAWGQSFRDDFSKVICTSTPPTPVVAGMVPHPSMPGQMVANIQQLRPVMMRVDRACVFWDRKQETLIGAK